MATKKTDAKKTSVKEETKKTTKTTKETAPKKDTAKKTTKKAEKVEKETTKPATEKVEKKETVKKAADKKAPAKKSTTKKTTEVFFEFAGKQINPADVTEAVKKAYVDAGNKASSIKSMKLYVKAEDSAVYFVINDSVEGKIVL